MALDKAKDILKKAAVTAGEAAQEFAGILGETTQDIAGALKEKALDAVSDEKLADLIISAMNKEEKVNKMLAQKGSQYRIGEVSVEMSIPPSITFVIVREKNE